MQSVFHKDELRRRLNNAKSKIWYVPILAKNDISKYNDIRNADFIDGMNTLEILIKST